jgi:hypothetical protein
MDLGGGGGIQTHDIFVVLLMGEEGSVLIEFMKTKKGSIAQQVELVQHNEEFYKKLFGKEERGTIRLARSMWQEEGRLNTERKERLIIHFMVEEDENAIKEMRTETTLGPDGFLVIFYKNFLGVLKWWIMQMMDDFYKGNLNLSRINYGIIILIPKLKEVADIKQYKPTCLLNVFYKLFTKILVIRLMEVTDEIITENETTFIRGRPILEGGHGPV